MATRLLLLIGLLVAILIAWGMRFLNEDLFVALCAGRDTVNGLLGKPDQWSFNTGEQIWIDQSWLSHLLYYLSYLGLGEAGPVLLKGVLLVLCVCLLYGHCRRLGCSTEASLSALTVSVLCLAPFCQIRAENFGLLYFVLFTLLVQGPRSWGRWRNLGILAVMVLWTGSHGSAMLGLWLLALRLAVDLLPWFLNRFGVFDGAAHQTDSVISRPVSVHGGGFGMNHEDTKTQRKPTLRSKTRTSASYVLRGLVTLWFNSLGSTNGVAERLPQSVGLPSFREEDTGLAVLRGDPLGWSMTLLATLGVMAFVNPYGTANLSMPFRQLSATAITTQSTDWVPLLDLESIGQVGFLQPLDVVPFLTALTLATILLATAAAGLLQKSGLRNSLVDLVNRDRLMVVLVPAVLVLMAFRFRRLMLFASLALVPMLGCLLDHAARWREQRLCAADKTVPRPGNSRIAPLAALSLVCLLGWAFARTTVVPYLPGNPMRPDRPLISQLMSFDSYNRDVVRFLTDNNIRGRSLATWTLSNYLLFHTPGISVFMDCRDQSAYSDEVIRRYFFILNSSPQDAGKVLEILDRARVEVLVLATNPRDFRAATVLMATRRWGCIYKDDEVFVLARADSERFGPSIVSSDLEKLVYSDPRIRLVSTAVLAQFMQGGIPGELLATLQQIVSTNPDPNLFSLITAAMNGQNRCLTAACREYLVSSAELLSAKDYMVANGAKTILESLVRVLTILGTNESQCNPGRSSDRYERLKDQWERKLAEVRGKYLGYRSR